MTKSSSSARKKADPKQQTPTIEQVAGPIEKAQIQPTPIWQNMTITERVCAAKAEIPAIAHDGQHDKQGWTFASTDSVFEACRPILAKWGLDLHFDIEEFTLVESGKDQNGKQKAPWMRLKAKVGFVGEEWVTRYLLHPCYIDGAPQGMGAAQSYIERQFLRNRLQLSTGDVDSENAGGEAPTGSSEASPQAQTAKRITAEQAQELGLLISEGGLDLEKFLEVGGVERIEDIPAHEFENAKKAIQSATKRRAKQRKAEAEAEAAAAAAAADQQEAGDADS